MDFGGMVYRANPPSSAEEHSTYGQRREHSDACQITEVFLRGARGPVGGIR